MSRTRSVVTQFKGGRTGRSRVVVRALHDAQSSSVKAAAGGTALRQAAAAPAALPPSSTACCRETSGGERSAPSRGIPTNTTSISKLATAEGANERPKVERKSGRRRHKSHELRRHLGAPRARTQVTGLPSLFRALGGRRKLVCDAGSRHTAGHEPHDCASSHVIYVGRLHKQGQTKPTKSCGSLGASSRVYLGHADRVRGSLGGCVGRRFMMGTVQLVGVCLVFVCQSARRRLGRPGLIIGVLAVYCLLFSLNAFERLVFPTA